VGRFGRRRSAQSGSVGTPAGRALVRRSATGGGLLLASFWVACLALAPLPAGAQGLTGLLDPSSKQAPAVPDPTDRKAVSDRLAKATAERDAAAQTQASAAPSRAAQAAAMLEQLDALEALGVQELDVLDRIDRAPTSEEAAPPPDAAPSIFALDALYERQFARDQERTKATESLKSSRASLESARSDLQAAEKARRDAARTLEQAPSGQAQEAKDALGLAVLASRVAAERVDLRTLEVRLAQQRLDATGTGDEADLTDRIASMRASLAQGDGTSAVDFAELTRRDAELRRTREATERLLSSVELRLEAASNRYGRSAEPSAAALVEVEALTARRDAIRQEIDLLEAQTERLGSQRELWSDWLRLIEGKVTRADSLQIASFAKDQQDALSEAELRLQGRMADLQSGLRDLGKRLAESAPGTPATSALLDQRRAYERILKRQRTEIEALEHERRVAGRVLDEVDRQFGRIDPLGELVRAVGAVRSFWGYEITVVEDSPITVGSLIIALVLMSMGMWASRRVSALVGRLAMSRFTLDPGAANALQTLSFYMLLVAFGLLALRVVHFPLTAFTVLGGALAIGIGFGSQNVMNNFISGLILMLERPVRVHDLVEIDGNHGSIERIGARSTQIRATDGRYIIVPNSFFLETNVVNWTLSDELIRTSVAVGVIYGSPTKLVEKLIRQVVDEEPQILRNPEPIILFEEFGDNSLNFEVHFWVVSRSPLASRRIASVVRFKIDDIFREHGLVIAFPQRDVHLDSVRPLEIRLVDREEGGTDPKGDAD
jgi:small-conductance mechanosensitive channel